MRKKLLSVLLTITMILSIVPQQVLADIGSTSVGLNDNDVEVSYSGGAVSDNSPVTSLTVNIVDGVVTGIKATPNNKVHNTGTDEGTMGVVVASTFTYMYKDPEDETAEPEEMDDLTNNSVNTDNLIDSGADYSGAYIPIVQVTEGVATTDSSGNVIEHIFNMDNAIKSTNPDFTTDCITGVNAYNQDELDAMTEIPIEIAVVSKASRTRYVLTYHTTVPVNGSKTITIPEGGDTPTDTEISSVALDVTAPKIGETPATTATTTTTGVVANPAVTWDPADSTFAKNQAVIYDVTSCLRVLCRCISISCCII